MAKRDKRIAAMRQNPKNVRPQDLEAVLLAEGFSMRQQGTSHRIYVRGSQQLTVPQRHPFLLPTYVKQALSLIETEHTEDEE
jgi:predicted RNA binding protein YcfA (HicA-like mRNA interferase family)